MPSQLAQLLARGRVPDANALIAVADEEMSLFDCISVKSEAELQRRKWRFLLRDAKWTVLD